MGAYRISELAERVGVPATTLRFYEREGLLPAARTASGYRQYTDDDLDRVRFVGAAKQLGLSLAEIRELLVVWAGGRCRDVRDDLRPRLVAQVATAEERIAALRVFRDRLTAALDHLRVLPAKDGPCDPACAFLHDLSHRRSPEPPIACSLDAGDHRARVGEWSELLDGAEVTVLPDGGRSAVLPVGRVERAARLVAAEQECCPFLSFRLEFAGGRVELVAHAPDGAGALLAALFDRAPVADEACPC